MSYNLNIDLSQPPPPILGNPPHFVPPVIFSQQDARSARKKPSRFSTAPVIPVPPICVVNSLNQGSHYPPSNRPASREKLGSADRSEASSYERRGSSRSRTSSCRDSQPSHIDKDSSRDKRTSRDSHRRTDSRDSRDSKSRSSRYRDEPDRRKRSSERSKRDERSKSRQRSSTSSTKKRPETERDRVLAKWRKNYCETPDEIQLKLDELANNEEKKVWIRSSPADVYYKRLKDNEVESTSRLDAVCNLFAKELLTRGEKAKAQQQPYVPPFRKRRICRHKTERCSSSDSSSSELDLEEDRTMEELTRKTKHPYRLHADLWHNETNEMNDGPLCRCSAKSQQNGIRHGIYPGETGFAKCNPNSNNAGKLFHYRITISPPTNFLTKTPTLIKYDEHEFLFEGFSLFTHEKIDDLPTCKVIRFNIEYTILYVEEQMPENFTIRELDLFCEYLSCNFF